MTAGFDFYEGSVSEGTAPKITVRKGGQLVLTSGAVDMLGDDAQFVQIGLASAASGVGVKGQSAQSEVRLDLGPLTLSAQHSHRRSATLTRARPSAA